MKCLLIIDSLGSGGAERQCVSLAIGLKQKAHEVLVLGYAKGNHFLPELNSFKIDYKFIESSHPVSRIIKFRKAIQKYNPEVIITFLQTSSFLAEISSFPRKPWKLIVSERTDITGIDNIKLKILLQLHRIADKVTTNSQNSSLAILNKAAFLKNKIQVIYNGLDHKRFTPPEKYSVNERKILVVVSSHQANKNAFNLIMALKSLKDSNYSQLPVIHWYGSDVSYYTNKPCDLYLQTKEMIKQYDLLQDLILCDPVPDIENVYRKADALLLCSYKEGLPNAVCEGMACGLPVLMSEVSDYEILTKGNGYHFDPRSFANIAAAIKWFCDLYDEEIVRMRSISRKKAERLFPVNKMVESYIKLFQ